MYVTIITECSTKCHAASGVTAMSHGFVRKRGSSTRRVTRTSAFQMKWTHSMLELADDPLGVAA